VKLSQFTSLLQSHSDKQFHLVLPGDSAFPVSFHITEAGHVTKNINCGGKLHSVQTCQLQAWLGSDTDHRLRAGKMAGVLGLAQAKGVLPARNGLNIEIEYEDTALSQYPVARYAVTDAAVVLTLAAKHTDCLAKESCLPMVPGTDTGCGCGPAGCC